MERQHEQVIRLMLELPEGLAHVDRRARVAKAEAPEDRHRRVERAGGAVDDECLAHGSYGRAASPGGKRFCNASRAGSVVSGSKRIVCSGGGRIGLTITGVTMTMSSDS